MAQFVYTMHRVGKVVPPKRHILKNISLSFFPGAKIGVLGLNGAGKSTLLRIMAGIDTEIEGEARPQPGIKIGYLPQEPQLNPEHTVRESVEEAVAEVVNALKGLDEVYAKYAEPDADFDKLAAQQGKFEEIIQAHDGHNLNVQLERAADALRLPDWDAKIANLSGGERRRVALCRLLLEKPDMLLLDEPTNHLDAESVAWLERFLHDFEGTAAKVFRGKATTPPGWSRKTSVWRRKLLRKPHAANLSRKNSSGFARARKAVSLRAKPAWRALKSLTTLNIRNVTRLTNCSFRQARVWAIKFWKSAICANPTATAF